MAGHENTFFWHVTLCVIAEIADLSEKPGTSCFCSEDGGSRFLQVK